MKEGYLSAVYYFSEATKPPVGTATMDKAKISYVETSNRLRHKIYLLDLPFI